MDVTASSPALVRNQAARVLVQPAVWVLGPLVAFQQGACCVLFDKIDARSLADSIRDERIGYFAGGDCVSGGQEVVNAVAEGKRAAAGIASLIESGDVRREVARG